MFMISYLYAIFMQTCSMLIYHLTQPTEYNSPCSFLLSVFNPTCSMTSVSVTACRVECSEREQRFQKALIALKQLLLLSRDERHKFTHTHKHTLWTTKGLDLRPQYYSRMEGNNFNHVLLDEPHFLRLVYFFYWVSPDWKEPEPIRHHHHSWISGAPTALMNIIGCSLRDTLTR